LTKIIGSVLHGAYGDYYQQLLCLKSFKKKQPHCHLFLFFLDDFVRKEFDVFDLSFADRIVPIEHIKSVGVDRFLQFQIHDKDLQSDLLSRLDPQTLARFDFRKNLKPWSILRKTDLKDPENQLLLNEDGKRKLIEITKKNEIDNSIFQNYFTVAFLWRYRLQGEGISPALMPSRKTIFETKQELLTRLIQEYDAYVVISGMNLLRTKENWKRVGEKYLKEEMKLPTGRHIYLKGLNWGLEIEIMRRCSLALLMPSGFSEALWMRRSLPTQLIDSPPHYLAKLVWNRMPFFNILSPPELLFQLSQSHTAEKVLAHMKKRKLLPLLLTKASRNCGFR